MRMMAAPWWVRPGLDIDDAGRLRVVGRDAETLAREHGTPLFVYDRARFAENARALQTALAQTGSPSRVRFAMKANPLPEVLEVFRGLGAPGTRESVGIDACSPGRGRARDRLWLATGRDQLHGHQCLRARPGRPARSRRAPEPRRDQPDRAIRPAGAGGRDRDPDRPRGRGRLQRAPRVRRRPADEVRDRAGAPRRGRRGGGPSRPHDRYGPFPRWLGLACRRAGRLRASVGAWRGGRPPPAWRRASHRRGERRWWSRGAGPGGGARGRSRRVRGRAREASRPARGHDRLRAGRPPEQGRGDPAGRGRHGRTAARRDVRRSRHRLERELLVFHLPVRPGVRRLPRSRGRRGRRP